MTFFQKLLAHYSLSEEEFNERKNVGFSILNPISHMEGFSSTIELINRGIENKKKFVIYGDYDVDGMTATSIIYLALKQRGIKAGYFIPSRYKQGYGLNVDILREFHKKGYEYLILVDNGISLVEEVKLAKEMGMTVIIIDHHQTQVNLPQADAIIHQFLTGYTSYNISAAFLSMLVYFALVNKQDDYIIALAGIAVISDMMEIKGMNLSLLKRCLEILNQGKYPQFNYLLFNSPVKGEEKVLSSSIAYKIVSPLNSLGRMDIASLNNNGVKFLTEDKLVNIEAYYKFIEEVNFKKKDLLKKYESAASETISGVSFTYSEDLPIGLIGLLANRKLDENNYLSFALAKQSRDSSVLVGSARSKSNVDLSELIAECKDRLIKYGGHKNACGFSIKEEDYPQFKRDVVEYLQGKDFQEVKRDYISISEEEINASNISLIYEFEPFGYAFEEPSFTCEIDLSKGNRSKDFKHLFVEINDTQICLFNCPLDVKSKKKLILHPMLNYFNHRYFYKFRGEIAS